MATVITVPNTDPKLLAFSLNFSEKISATPTAFALTGASDGLRNFARKLRHGVGGVRSCGAVQAGHKQQERGPRGPQKPTENVGLGCAGGPGGDGRTESVTGPDNTGLRRQPQPVPVVSPAVDIVSVVGRTVKVGVSQRGG